MTETTHQGLTNQRDSIQLRHFDVDRDLPGLVQLQTIIEEADQTGEDVSEETLKAQLHLPGHDPAQDGWVATIAHEQEQIIGFGTVWKVPQNAHADIYVGVHPAWRRQGIGGKLLQHILQRAQALSSQHILAYANIRHQDALAFLHKRAFAPVASYTLMRLAAEKQVPQAEWPAGYTIRQYRPEADFPLLLDMYNRAFQGLWGHWEHVTAEALHGILEQENPAGIFLLITQSGEVVGTCRGEMSEHLSTKRGKETGYLDAPGIVPAHRSTKLYLSQLLYAAHWVRTQASQTPIDIELESWGDDPQVLSEYQQAGFEKVEQQVIHRWSGQ
ncbi:GNAT family N-acetyltransferase [Ktedonosporobacter rubrisoli]|uniref:GNAT family N-acetyltransferase n=1 Tax=Ktedonosporobacter rubrisoli TaxID=2509675 RepID=A0A4P6JN10_KTERU|nr:GNAT family N-acetyltransferase [Ktedonosporobacter rubrisoli]QBD76096.1 GNAT family N-acetyltransferase [Ktedonosporobacter rubrisoli]